MLKVIENPAPGADGPRSQTSAAYEAIRSAILGGRHLPGHKLKIAQLAEELDVSPGAVREALSRLVPEQLVVSRDQRGFVVAPLSIADLEELTDLRCEIEALALRRSVAEGDVDWEVGIVAAEHRLRKQPVLTDDGALHADWIRSHRAFHAALVGACGNQRLLALQAQLYEQSERYRGLSVHVDHGREVAGEHKAMMDAALARDADGLVGAMVGHIRTTTALIIAAIEHGRQEK